MNVLPALMHVTLMPNAKILLDLSNVPAKRVFQGMEKHALVRFTSSSSFPVRFYSNSTILDNIPN